MNLLEDRSKPYSPGGTKVRHKRKAVYHPMQNILQDPSLPNTPGIYMILNNVSGSCYIGSTKYLAERCVQHFRELRRGKHCNRHLQSSYKLHGPDAFTYHIIEHVSDPSDIVAREQFYIDLVHPEYNLAPFANSPVLEKHSPEHVAKRVASRKATMELLRRVNPDALKRGSLAPESIEKALETKRSKRALDPTYGVRDNLEHTPETKEKISKANKGKSKTREQTAKMVATRRENGSFKSSPEKTAKFSAFVTGRKQSPEQVAKRVSSRKATMEAKKLENPDAYKQSNKRDVSPDHLARMTEAARVANTGRKRSVSPEHMAKMNAAAHTPETAAKISASMTGRKLSPESIAKREATRKARHEAGEYAPVTWNMTPETIAKRTATLKATNEAKRLENPDVFKKDPAHMSKMTEAARTANIGRSRDVSPDHLAKMTEAARTPEAIAKMKATKRANREAKLKSEQQAFQPPLF